MGPQLADFTVALEQASGRSFADAADLEAFAAREYRTFWRVFLAWSRAPLAIGGDAEPVCVGDNCEHARFFPGLRLSYADSVLNLQAAPAGAPALTEVHADGSCRTWTRGELRAQVARLAQALLALGVRAGDRVVAVMRNDARAAVTALAVAAVGATFSSAATDMGLQALRDRFEPQRPVLLAAHLEGGAQEPALGARVAQLLASLPSVRTLLALDDGALEPRPGLRLARFDEAAARGDAGAFAWPRFAFDHPLFAMFSSGTTGRPKCILHGAGGSLLEHVKEHRLHTDLRPGERLYFHTSCGWMMWNWQLSALASGVEIVTYDGPVDSVQRLWQLVARQRVHVFGTSPGYLKMCEDAGFAPSQLDLSALRAVLSTGAVLHERQFHWVTRQAKDVPVQSISGGTDILGCFVLGHPGLPVRAGYSQARSLGLDVQAWADGQPTPGIGQLVCVNPFPSRPLGLDGDADGSRFHAAYFSQNPGVWTHGDLVEFPPGGGARLHGRTDGVLNVRGNKFHPSEVLRLLAGMPGIADAMVVARSLPAPQVVALLVLAPGHALTPAFVAGVRTAIRDALTAAHVPDLVLDVPELPVTHNGKPSEAAARAALDGEEASNATSLRNPQSLDAIRERAARAVPAAQPVPGGESLVARLCRVWAAVLGLSAVQPADDFFALGGNSLLAARLLRAVQDATGSALPLSALLVAPTVQALAALVERERAAPPSSPVRLRDGVGRPLFLVHGLSGSVMECRGLVRALRAGAPVWGLQAQGLDGTELPLLDVESMAAAYVAQVRQVQPRGPYALAGFSFGGQVAYEMACQLAAAGERIEPLVLLDPYVRRDLPRWRDLAERGWHALGRLLAMSRAQRAAYLRGRLHRARGRGVRASEGLGLLPPQARVFDAMAQALDRYRPRPYAGPVLLVRAAELVPGYVDPLPAWRAAASQLRVTEVRGRHLDLVAANVEQVAQVLDEALAATPSADPARDAMPAWKPAAAA